MTILLPSVPSRATKPGGKFASQRTTSYAGALSVAWGVTRGIFLLILIALDPAPGFADSIQSIEVDGSSSGILSLEDLPSPPSYLQLDWPALSLSIPELARFGYATAGINDEVDEVWDEAGTALDFAMAPAYYRAWWFKGLSAALAAACFGLLYLYRLHVATARIQEQLGTRLQERERIARELHDTFLQGFQGLMLRFQAVLKTLPEDAPARAMIEKALERADDVLLEGRRLVQDLRAEGSTGNDLPDHLVRCGEDLTQSYPIAFSVSVIGTPQAIDPIVSGETYRIAREALANAFMHSHGSKVEVELTYNVDHVCLRIRDDGLGIGDEILSAGRSGHWGLSGMRERAQSIGAAFRLWSRSGSGTEMELTIPSALAYPGGGKQSLWSRLTSFRLGRIGVARS